MARGNYFIGSCDIDKVAEFVKELNEHKDFNISSITPLNSQQLIIVLTDNSEMNPSQLRAYEEKQQSFREEIARKQREKEEEIERQSEFDRKRKRANDWIRGRR